MSGDKEQLEFAMRLINSEGQSMPDHNPEAARREAIDQRKLSASRIAAQIVRSNWFKKQVEGEGEVIDKIEKEIANALLGQIEQHEKNIAQSRREAVAATWERAVEVAVAENERLSPDAFPKPMEEKFGGQYIIDALTAAALADGHGLRGGEGSV